MRFERVIVTGGSGLLGRFVVDQLKDICAASVLDLKAPSQDVPYFETDILDLDGVRAALAGQDAMIHLAGIDDGDAQADKDYSKPTFRVRGTCSTPPRKPACARS